MSTTIHKSRKKAAKKKAPARKAAKKKVTKKAAKKKTTKKKAGKKRSAIEKTEKKAGKKKAPTKKRAKKNAAKKSTKKTTAGRGKVRARRTREAAAVQGDETATMRVARNVGCTDPSDDDAFDGLFATDFVKVSLTDNGLAGLMSDGPDHHAADSGDRDPNGSTGAQGPWYCFPIRMWRELMALMKSR